MGGGRETPARHGERKRTRPDHIAVTVAVNGRDILSIETNSLSGKANLTAADMEAIRWAAESLWGFAGQAH